MGSERATDLAIGNGAEKQQLHVKDRNGCTYGSDETKLSNKLCGK